VIDLETGEPLGPHKQGEICIKSPHIMLEYINNPEATAFTIRNGWLYSGMNEYCKLMLIQQIIVLKDDRSKQTKVKCVAHNGTLAM
jgi:long-subunit acyl-CoA synthetase (AMP-forming)